MNRNKQDQVIHLSY